MSLKEDISRILGPEKVSGAPDVLAAHAGDKWYASVLPEAVVFPESTEDVSLLLRYASSMNIPVTARGGGVGYVGGCVPVRGGISLSLERMNRILEISPEDGVAVVEPGVITADLQREARALGWFYPPDPASRKECSIGGNIATNAGGPRCLKYGVTRAYVLGLTVVLASGEVVECGGRTHKNKTGFDIGDLFIGSEGMLGIITRAVLRLIPHPEAFGALSAGFPQFPLAAAAVQRILNSGHLPSALEITDSFTLRAARNYLGDSALPSGCHGHLIVEVDGRRPAVREELDSLCTLLEECGATGILRADTEAEAEAIWQLRREFSYSLKATGMTKLNEDIVIPRSRLVALVEFCEALNRETGLDIACFGHSGDGNIHTNIMVDDYANPEKKALADACVDRLFHWVLAHGGAITGEHGIGLAKAKWFRKAVGEGAYHLHELVKSALDPKNLLNPGKMGLP